ncbi:MAG: CBS domain-containing protein [Methanocellales archaeon]|nr:CBS domain-containing protein [Methanocellales archaeon]
MKVVKTRYPDRRRILIKVQDVMSKSPVFIKGTEFMTKARQLIRDRHFRSLPVVDDEKRVMGLITRQDVLRVTSTKSNVTVDGFALECPTITPDMDMLEVAQIMLTAKLGRLPVVKSVHDRTLVGIISIVDIFKHINLDRVPVKMVGEVMSTDVKVCHPKDPVSKVWANMDEFGYSGFPVVKRGKLIGMVTRRDIIKAGYARMGKENEHGGRMSSSPPVEKIMSTPVYTVHPGTSLKEAAELMLTHDIGRLPVIENDKLVGIVDRYDLIRGYIRV